MKSLTLSVFALAAIGLPFAQYEEARSASRADEPPVTLAQERMRGGNSGGMQTGQSGTGKETDAGKGIVGKPSPFGTDQPTTGDFSPDKGAKKDHPSQRQQQPTSGGSDYPSGIGEKGTGQASSSDRSGASTHNSPAEGK